MYPSGKSNTQKTTMSHQRIKKSLSGEEGDRVAALAAAQQSVDRFRHDNDLTSLSSALYDVSNRLAELGRREEALSPIEEAVAIRRQLAETDPTAFLPTLASSLAKLSNRLAA